MDFAQIVQTVALYAIPVLFAITLHEAAHGYVARHYGDNTAHMLGRITLNPIKHIDPLGTIAMPLLLYFATSGAFLFGYAKPVPVNSRQLRNPKRDMIWVALAGPGANLIQAIAWTVLFYLLLASGVEEPFFLKMCQAGLLVNLVMFAFNLFPLPPLDGGRILVGLLPWKQAALVSRVEPWTFYIAMALMITVLVESLTGFQIGLLRAVAGVFADFWLRPIMMLTGSAIETLLTPVRMLLL